MITFPLIAEQVIETRVKSLLGLKKEDSLGTKELNNLAIKVKTLSDYFTKSQDDRPDYYLNDKLLMAAYMAYFVPSNLLKIETPLTELLLHPDIKMSSDEISFLDLGSGPGTASAGFIDFFFTRLAQKKEVKSISITAVDRVKENLLEAELFLNTLWERYLLKCFMKSDLDFKLNTLKLDLHQMQGSGLNKKYDFVVMSNSLVETGEGKEKYEKRMAMIEFIVEKCLKENGSLIIIEPALRDSSRDLLMLRDSIIKNENRTIYSPCIDPGPCGALENIKDWCHEGYRWQPPQIVEEIDKRTAFEKRSLKFSYLLIRKDGLSLRDLIGDRNDEKFRVVSDLMIMKGDKRVFLCGNEGRFQVGRLDRDKTGANALFEELGRGDIVEIKGLKKKGKLVRVGKEAKVTKLFFR